MNRQMILFALVLVLASLACKASAQATPIPTQEPTLTSRPLPTLTSLPLPTDT